MPSQHRVSAQVSRHFDLYGLRVEVSSLSERLVEEVRRDFAYFQIRDRDHLPREGEGEREGEGHVRVEMCLSSPPYSELPATPASLVTPRNICFHNGRRTFIDYFGKALAVFDREAKLCIVHGTDADLVHEIAYLFILSTVGTHLDARGLHRVHALGVSYRDRGILLLLPSGGGKSTVALELMRQPGFLLLGEDTPLIDRRGRILPFPLRLGVRPGHWTGIPSEHLRTVPRMEFDPKTLIDIEYFYDRLGTMVEPGLILVGERNLGDVAEILPLVRRRALAAMIRNVVVGLGVYQGMEFLIERGLWEVLGSSGVACSRMYNSLRLLARAPAYGFVLGRNIEKNCRTLLQFIHQTL